MNDKARISILIGSGVMMIIVGVWSVVMSSDKTQSAGFPFIGLGNLVLGISGKHASRPRKRKSLEYCAAAAFLVGILLLGIYWFRLLA